MAPPCVGDGDSWLGPAWPVARVAVWGEGREQWIWARDLGTAPGHTLLYNSDLNMKEQLQELRTPGGQPYRLLELPLPSPIFDEDGEQLPATYANFLILNGAVLVPTYHQPDNDSEAIGIIQRAFPDREMVPIDSRSIIKQHGSIHCCTMQFPEINETSL